MTCGVYIIKNKINQLCYIGSSINIEKRWKDHKKRLRYNNHKNQYLQRAWNKYGEENFEFKIIEETLTELRVFREQHYINAYKSYIDGYNLLEKADEIHIITNETKQKLSEIRIGKKRSFETIRRISYALKANGANRKFDKWPCKDAHKCKCQKCNIKRKELLNEQRAIRRERGHNLLKSGYS